MKKFLLVLSLLILCSCREYMLDEGITTTVSGRISDKFGASVSGVTVEVGEFKRAGMSNVYLVKELASAITNQNGDYSITFTTTGSGSSCQIFISPDAGIPRKYLGDKQAERLQPLGGHIKMDFNGFFNLVPCAVTLDTADCTVFPISVYHDSTNSFGNNYSISAQGTVTLTFYTTQYFDEPIQFGRTNSAGVYQKTIKHIPAGSYTLQNPYPITLKDSDFN